MKFSLTLFRLKGLFAVLTFLMSALCITAQSVQRNLFDPSFLHEIKIESPLIPNLWDSVSREFIMVNITIDGYRLDSVGIKIRGATSATSDQIPLEVDLNKFVDSNSYDSYKKFILRNNHSDPYLQRESLAYTIYRRVGLPSPKSVYAEVFVNDESRGVYSIVEEIDKRFLNNHFNSADGSLYKGDATHKGLSVEPKEGTMEAFDHFRRKIRSHNLAEFVDLNNYLKHLGTDIIVGDWDSYAYNRHNFYYYFDPLRQLMHLINWDHNFAFTDESPNPDPYPIGTYPSIDNLIEYPDLKRRYEQTLCELLTFVVDSSFMTNLVTNQLRIIESNRSGWKAASPEPLIDYMLDRKNKLQDTLRTLGVECAQVAFPLEQYDLVINEIMVRDDHYGRKKKSTGWIELYNNSSKSIWLDKHYYLSNDQDFLKKWSFQHRVEIPTKGYLIIWTDAFFQKEGLHTGFKLNKDGGLLFLTYEDMTIIDHVQYPSEEKDQSFARSPNGKGAFGLSSPSFNANND